MADQPNTVQPTPEASAMPAVGAEQHLPHLFKKRDWAVAGVTFLIAGLRFLYDMSPEVTLQDSGELVTGAFNFGVPHPPGYPLWALLCWIWAHAIAPFGNPAWRVCTLSVLTGALVVGVLTLLMSRSIMTLFRALRWGDEIDDSLKHWIALTMGATVALMFGFNRGVWLWACVPEMRVLNVFLFILTACTFFAWMLRPERRGFLYATVLVYGLGIANHQTIFVMAVPFMVGAIAVELLESLEKTSRAELAAGFQGALKEDWVPVAGAGATMLLVKGLGALLSQPAQGWVLAHWGEFGSRILCLGVFTGEQRSWFFGQLVKVIVGWWVCAVGIGMLTRVNRFKAVVELTVAIFFAAAAWGFVMAWAGMQQLKEFMPVPVLGDLPLEGLAMVMAVLGAWYLGYMATKKLVNWRRALLCAAFFLVGVGFYAYMPISSATNPPMNWGYTRTAQGFLHHITRGQYERLHIASPLSREFYIQLNLFTSALVKQYTLILDAHGSWMAVTREAFGNLTRGVKMGVSLVTLAKMGFNGVSVLVLGLLSLGLPVLAFRDMRSHGRAWLIFVWAAFLTASIGLLFIINPALDRQNQEINLKFFAPAHGFFAMLLGYGMAFGLAALVVRWKQIPRAVLWVTGIAAVLLLPWIPFNQNLEMCHLRGHDFGYQFGYRMFYPGGGYPPMEKDAVLYGGTDPGRFVPTYMIFCESRVSPKDRFADSHFDPEGGQKFDRRDVYIITQNALADSTYMSYIRDHYDYSRPDWNKAASLTNRPPWQNRMLGWAWGTLDRKNMYPRTPIWIPGENDVQRAFQEYVQNLQVRHARGEPMSPDEQVDVIDGKVSVRGVAGVMNINGILTRWIFDRNKEKHAFYIEESYVIPWMFPYLEPAGIIMKIDKTPLPSPEEDPFLWSGIVRRDRAYWDRLEKDFTLRPEFKQDSDAQKTFSKLRSAIGGVYAYRHLTKEAEYAFKQARRICAESPEASFRLAQLYMENSRIDDAIASLRSLQSLDPLNFKIEQAIQQLLFTKKAREDIATLEAARRVDPRNIQLLLQLIQTYGRAGMVEKIAPLCESFTTQPNIGSNELIIIAQTYLQVGQIDRAVATLQTILDRNPRDSEALFFLAIIRANQGAANEALDLLERAIKISPSLREQARSHPGFAPLRSNPRFVKIVGAPPVEAPFF